MVPSVSSCSSFGKRGERGHSPVIVPIIHPLNTPEQIILRFAHVCVEHAVYVPIGITGHSFARVKTYHINDLAYNDGVVIFLVDLTTRVLGVVAKYCPGFDNPRQVGLICGQTGAVDDGLPEIKYLRPPTV